MACHENEPVWRKWLQFDRKKSAISAEDYWRRRCASWIVEPIFLETLDLFHVQPSCSPMAIKETRRFTAISRFLECDPIYDNDRYPDARCGERSTALAEWRQLQGTFICHPRDTYWQASRIVGDSAPGYFRPERSPRCSLTSFVIELGKSIKRSYCSALGHLKSFHQCFCISRIPFSTLTRHNTFRY